MMPDLSRRLLCRVGFVLLCLAPTICVGMCAITVHWNRQQDALYQQWKTRILQETGFRADIASIELGNRGDMVFHDLALTDPETNALVVRVRRVHIAPAGKRGWVVEAAYPEIPADQVDRLWEPLYDRLRSSRGPGDWSGLVSAHNVTLRQEGRSHTLSQFECQFGGSPSGGFAQMEFLLDGYAMTERARIRVHRNRDKVPPETTVFVQTGPSPLPCSAFTEFIPALGRLGPEAQFQGKSEWRLGKEGWRGERFEGKLTRIDMSALITDVFSHHLWAGECDLEIRRAEFEAGRLVGAEGIMTGEEGTLSRSLYAGAMAEFGWKSSQDEALEGARLRYRRLGFDFRIDTTGMLIRGRCGSPGVILENDQGPVIWDNPQPAQVVDLVRILVPETRHHVPATRQTSWLTNLLPVPSYEPSSRNAHLPPDAPPVRLRE